MKNYDVYIYNPAWQYEGQLWRWVDVIDAPDLLSALQFAKSAYGNLAAVEECV